MKTTAKTDIVKYVLGLFITLVLLVLTHSTAKMRKQLQAAYANVAQALSRAPQLYDTHLDQALLVLALSIKRAQRSPKLRPPRYRHQDLPF